MIMQQVNERTDRSIALALGTTGVSTELPVPEADKMLGWNAGETALENKDIQALGAVDVNTLIKRDGSNGMTGALNTARATVTGHATDTPIWAAAGNEVAITGTPDITDFPDAPQAGASRVLYPAAGTIFRNNANIAVQGGVDYTAAAGDIVTIHAITTSTFRVTQEPAAMVQAIVAQATAEAGTDTAPRLWTAERVKQAIAALGTGITIGTPVSASGTSIDFTSIPSGTKQITVNISGLSTNGTNSILLQIGDSGGLETTGYTGAISRITNGASPTTTQNSTGFYLSTNVASGDIISGSITLTLLSAASNLWAASGNTSRTDAAVCMGISGDKALSATLDRLSIVAGGNTFDAGTINITYEG
jgi:hypothetical protein